MGALTRLACLATLAGLGADVMACGQSDPQVTLTAEERALWAPRPPDRSVVPVLLVRDVDAFARQMALLDHAGYTTITLDDLVAVREATERRPPAASAAVDVRRGTQGHVDGRRRDPATARHERDAVRRRRPRGGEDPSYLTWDELDRLARSDRWDVQLQSGTGNRPIRYGAGPDDVGPFYAYRGAEEVLGGWRERVFSDITYGEEQLAFHVPSYRPLAIAPPEGNYGQAGSNDPRIARELRARLLDSFELIFTQDRSGLARPGASNPFGRIEVTRDVTGEELHALLTCGITDDRRPCPPAHARRDLGAVRPGGGERRVPLLRSRAGRHRLRVVDQAAGQRDVHRRRASWPAPSRPGWYWRTRRAGGRSRRSRRRCGCSRPRCWRRRSSTAIASSGTTR